MISLFKMILNPIQIVKIKIQKSTNFKELITMINKIENDSRAT